MKELTAILVAKDFNVIAQKRRGPVSELEYPYKKLLLVSQGGSQRPPAAGEHPQKQSEDLIDGGPKDKLVAACSLSLVACQVAERQRLP